MRGTTSASMGAGSRFTLDLARAIDRIQYPSDADYVRRNEREDPQRILKQKLRDEALIAGVSSE